MKTLNVKDETHEELKKIGNYGDTMDDIIRKLIKHHKDSEKGGD